jgi:hypothetical protein
LLPLPLAYPAQLEYMALLGTATPN